MWNGGQWTKKKLFLSKQNIKTSQYYERHCQQEFKCRLSTWRKCYLVNIVLIHLNVKKKSFHNPIERQSKWQKKWNGCARYLLFALPYPLPVLPMALYVGMLTPMNYVNWLHCPLAPGGVWPMGGTVRRWGKGKNQGGFFSPPSFVPARSLWVGCVSPSKHIAPVRHSSPLVGHPCPSGLVVLRAPCCCSLWGTALALVFLNQRSSKRASETPWGPAPLSEIVWGQIYHHSRWW